MLSFVILYAVALWVLSSWLRLPTKQATSVPTRAPYSHHDVVIARSKALEAYADFVNDCEDAYILC
jgi:hypothetical protein